MANKKVKFELTAVDKTKAAFDKVTKGLKGVGGAAAGATKGIAGVGLAATATATALALIVDKSFQAIDAIGKTSTQTGIATDTLQAFHLAARESGTTIEGANNALIKFARSVGDAQRGLKTQADIFKDIGVEVHNADGSMKSFDQILEETADGIMSLGDQTARATALANLFGRQGVVLTGAIKDLSETGLVNFIKRAKDLGIVLSTEVIRRTEKFNDAVGVIKMQLGSFVNNITTSFLPVFEKLQEKIAEAIQSMITSAGGMDMLGMKIANSIIDFSASAIEAVGELQFAIADFVVNLEQFLPKAKLSFGQFAADVLKKAPALVGTFGSLAEIMLDIQKAEQEIAIAEKKVVSQDFLNRSKKAADNLRGLKMTQDDLISNNQQLDDGLNKVKNTLTDLQSPIAVFKDNIEKLDKTLDTLAVNAMKKFEDAIVEGLKTGKLSFKDFADYVVEQLLRIAIQKLLIASIIDPFRNFLGGLVKGTGSDTGTQSTSALDIFEGGGFTGYGARAGGVDGRGGFPAILHPNETVIDHTKGQSMSPNININISANDANGFDELLVKRKNLLVSIISQAMNQRGNTGLI